MAAAQSRKPTAKKRGPKGPSSQQQQEQTILHTRDLYCSKCRKLIEVTRMKEDNDGLWSCKKCD